MNPNKISHSRPLATWLFTCAFMVFVMMVIGAITRLTGSGLSMVEWRPLMGALPPLNEAEWSRVFTLYQQSPQYQQVNGWMQLHEFKNIFFWEWFHRLWGRLIGLVFALPLAYFWIRDMIPRGYHLKFIGLLLLGGAQGFMGWYMVKSGLVDIPEVSHFRLAAHLSLAFIILGALVWAALPLTSIKMHPSPTICRHACLTLICISITIIWGAFTAGMDAGLVYNDEFPKMGDQWIPPDFWTYPTFFKNITFNHSAIQFTHRWLAMFTVAMVLGLWAHAQIKSQNFKILHLAAIMALIQMSLGIATLLSGVDTTIATAHQAGGATLFILLILTIYQTRKTR